MHFFDHAKFLTTEGGSKQSYRKIIQAGSLPEDSDRKCNSQVDFRPKFRKFQQLRPILFEL